MPEGHTIHGLARSMSELVGQTVTASSPQGRFPAEVIDGHKVEGTDAFGKHLFVDMSDGQSVHVHLGMRGKWLRFAPVTGDPMRQVRLRLATPILAWDLIAPTTCELLDRPAREAVIAKLGPDPLRPEADAGEALRRISAYNGPIGAALLDQGVIAGAGNVFRAEALHACRIAPTRPSDKVDDTELDCLWTTLRSMMSQAVEDGRIITVDSDDRLAVPEERSRRVYKQESCFDCGTAVQVVDLSGRTSYSCPTCQPL